MLNLSFAELTALLRDVCKTTYGQAHDYYEIADTLVWMEVQGFSGLSSVLSDYKNLSACPFGTQPPQVMILWDFQTNSLIPTAHMLGDLILAEHPKNAPLTLSNTRDVAALFPEMYRLANAGLRNSLTSEDGVIAQCSDSGMTLHVEAPNALTNLAWHMDTKPLAKPVLTTQDDIYQRNQTALLNGIPLNQDIYATLCECAAETLVPASEQSRHGAGD